MDEDLLREFNRHFHEFVVSDDYLEDYPNDYVGQQKAFDCFDTTVEDKKRLDGGTQFGMI